MVFDADRAPALEEDAGGIGVGHDRQVLAVARRAEISPRGAPTTAIGGRRLVIADTLLPGAVEVVVGWDPGLDRGLHHRIAERRAHRVRDVQRSADAMEVVGPALLVLGLLAIGQHRIPSPTVA